MRKEQRNLVRLYFKKGVKCVKLPIIECRVAPTIIMGDKAYTP
jgi:hypothetical protein